MECFVIFVMAWCWCNATESKPQNVSGYFLERLRFHNFILSSIHCNRKRKAITTITKPRIESPITSFQFQKNTVFELQLVRENKTATNISLARLRVNFVFEIIVFKFKVNFVFACSVLNRPQPRQADGRYAQGYNLPISRLIDSSPEKNTTLFTFCTSWNERLFIFSFVTSLSK